MKLFETTTKLLYTIGFLIVFNPICSAATDGEKIAKHNTVLASDYSLEDLAGVWVLKESDIESNKGLRISISGGQATLIDKAMSSFDIGDIKWSSIVKSVSNSFIYQELGTDGLHYCASLKFLDKDTIESRAEAPGVGRVQKWLRVNTPVKNPIGASLTSYSVKDLTGIWFRKASNNPNADGIEVEVTGTKGTIINKANSNFSVGHIKWSSISKKTLKTFDYKELGSDNNYYNATIKFLSKNRLEIRVGHSGAGNSQTWIRKGSEEATASGATDLAALEGNWRLSSSNGGTYDGMIVHVKGSTAKVTRQLRKSAYKNGDVKWKGITRVEGAKYAFSDINSKDEVTFSVIESVSEDQLLVKIGAAVPGNRQTWIRLDGTPSGGADATATATTLPCSISESMVLKNTAAAIDYVAECVVNITDKLTIEPGVVIAFKKGAGLGVYDGGSLEVQGTATKPVIMKAKDGSSNPWRGLHIEAGGNQINYLELSDAGANYVYCCNEPAAIYLKDGSLSLQNTKIKNSSAIGIIAKHKAIFTRYQANSIEGSAAEPMAIAAKHLDELKDAGSNFSGNGSNFIVVQKSDFNRNITVSKLEVPYLLEGEVYDVTASLTLSAGVEFLFKQNGGLGVFDEGSLNIQGTREDPVALKGNQAVKGYWRGIHIESSSFNNRFSHVTIADAGGDYVYCCNKKASLFLKSSAYIDRLEHVKITNGAAAGIYMNKNIRMNNISNVLIERHSDYPIITAPENLNNLNDRISVREMPATKNYISIFNGQVSNATTMYEQQVPYLVPTNVVIDIVDPLEVQAGTQVVFEEGAGLGVYDNGSIKAVGTSAKKIEFKGKEPVQGYWRGIHIETNSTQNVLKYVSVKNAGSNYVYCCNDKASIFLKNNGRLRLENSSLMDSGGCAVFVKTGASLSESGNTFGNNENGPICN